MVKKAIKLGLLENAIDSLEEGLKKYHEGLAGNAKSYKFAILNTSHFVELSFKYFLTQIHPLLIYTNPFSDQLDRRKTITMTGAINFFKHANEEGLLSYDDEDNGSFIADINWLKETRNKIEHCEFEFDDNHALLMMGKIISMLSVLYNNHEIDLMKKLPNELHGLYDEIINDYKLKLMLAIKEAKDKDEENNSQFTDFSEPNEHDSIDTLIDCFHCGNPTFVYSQVMQEYHCTFCHETDKVVPCQWCSSLFPISESVFSIEESGIFFCGKACLDRDMQSKGGE